MAVSRTVRVLLIIFSTVTGSLAQDQAQHSGQPGATVPERVILDEVSTIPVPSLPAESIAAPVFCEPDGGILFRLAMPETGLEDPLSVSSDGKTVVRFGKEKINDINRPVLLNMFLSGSDLYVLTRGSIPLGYETKWRTPAGDVHSQQAAKSSVFIAHFSQHEGTYAGSVPLDLPFLPLHLGVFENGDFLIAGADPATDEPRVAIVGSNGQLRKFVELPGDVHAQGDSGGSAKEKDPTALPRFSASQGGARSLRDAVYTSRIAKDGPNLLLYRPLSGPVFSVSPSGEARVHKLKVEGDYRLFTIKAARNSWIVEFIREVPHHGPATEFATYAFDSETGAPLREYFFPTDLGWGLACTDGNEFTFVMAETESGRSGIKLVKLAPSTRPN
ncbi:MAG: hypothetical protein WB952_00775 [Terriglobales bacterium]